MKRVSLLILFLVNISVLSKVALGTADPAAPPAAAKGEARVFLPAISRAFTPGIAPYVKNLPEPGNVTAIVDPGDGRLFIVLKEGHILVVSADGKLGAEPLLDIHEQVQAWPFEAGLLGLAVHPDFATNGFIYVYFTSGTQTALTSNIVRYTVGSDGIADPNTALSLLSFEQPAVVHQGGALQFGPADGYLYIAVGDGGTPRDEAGNAQSTASLLGKILRLDVDNGTPYAIPVDNPFAGETEKRGEIWALGLRNPWRISFDRETGDLYIGEVGESTWEEVNIIPAGSDGGLNFGWPCYEGNAPFRLDSCDQTRVFTPPVFTYEHQQAQYHCSITGGFVYRGRLMPELAGKYLFADYCAGTLWSLENGESGVWEARNWGDLSRRWSTFGERSDGELFLGATSSTKVYQIVPDGMPVTLPEGG